MLVAQAPPASNTGVQNASFPYLLVNIVKYLTTPYIPQKGTFVVSSTSIIPFMGFFSFTDKSRCITDAAVMVMTRMIPIVPFASSGNMATSKPSPPEAPMMKSRLTLFSITYFPGRRLWPLLK